jgi:integrase
VSRKRGNGEGSITKRKDDGRWMARYTVHTAAGRKRKTIYGKTRAEVAEKLAKAVMDRADGLVFDAGTLRIFEYLERWLADSVRGTVRDTTYENYAYLVRKYIVPSLGSVKLKALTPAHVQRFYREQLDSGLAPRTVQYLHTLLRKALKQAVKWGLIPRNVTDAVDAPRPAKKETKYFSFDQAKAFLKVASEDRFWALYVLALSTGLRRGELLGLRWEDLDLERGVLRVRRSLTPDVKSYNQPKSAKGRRSVRLTPGAVETLKSHKMNQDREKDCLGSLWQEQGLIFPSSKGTPFNPSNLLNRSFKPLLRRAGMPKIRFHDLRHTFATLMFSNGEHPKIVQEILGHAQITLTLDTYSHVLPSMQEGAVGRMGKLLD